MLRVFLSLAQLVVLFMFSPRAYSECGGNTPCPGAGATPEPTAAVRHDPGPVANLDDKSMPGGLLSSPFKNPLALEAGLRWDDNVSRSGGASPRLGDGIYYLGSGITKTIPTSGNTRLRLTGTLDIDKFERYEQLDNASLGFGAELQFRADGSFEAPTFGAFARLNQDETRSRMRRGHRSSVGVNVAAPVTDRIELVGVLAQNKRFASSTLFDTRDVSAKLNADFQFNSRGTLYLGGEHRRGDSVSSGWSSAQSAAISKVDAADDAFTGLVGYRYAARTTIWTLGYNFRLGNRDAFDFSWRRAVATPTQTQDHTGLAVGAPWQGNSSYTARQFTLAYMMRF